MSSGSPTTTPITTTTSSSPTPTTSLSPTTTPTTTPTTVSNTPTTTPTTPATTPLPPPVTSNGGTTSQISEVLTTPLTSVFQTTMVSTASNGHLSTYVVSSTSVYSAGSTITAPALPSSSSSNHTGAIAGGVIGGIALVSLLALFAVWYRSKHRFDDEFDGNFNPDRIVSGAGKGGPGDGATLPNVDFGNADTTITPFPAFPVASVVPVGAPNGPSMHQHDPSVVSNSTGSSAYSPYSTGGPYSTDYASAVDSKRLSPQQAAMMGAAGPFAVAGPANNDWRTVSPGPTLSTHSSLTGTNSTTNGSGNTHLLANRTPKEREALTRFGAPFGPLGLATQVEEPTSPPAQYYQQQQQQQQPVYDASGQPLQQPGMPPQGGFVPGQQQQAGPSQRVSSGVIVHQDAGRVPTKAQEAEEDRVEEPQEEIPPTYDSIGR